MGHEYFEWQVTPPVSCLYVIYWTVDAESVHTNGKMLGGGFMMQSIQFFPPLMVYSMSPVQFNWKTNLLGKIYTTKVQ